MIFYIEPKGMEILEYIPEKGEYIGSLNSNDPETKKVSKEVLQKGLLFIFVDFTFV